MNTYNNTKVGNVDTSPVNLENIQASFVPLPSIDIQSSASHVSELTNDTFCLPIDEKLDEEKEIIKKIEEATKSTFKVGQVFESAEQCKRAIKLFAQPLGFVASVSGQSMVCNRSDA